MGTSRRAQGRRRHPGRRPQAAGADTQVDLARRLEKPQSFVSSYEAGQRRVDVLELLRIAGEMGVAPGELFAEIERAFAGRWGESAGAADSPP